MSVTLTVPPHAGFFARRGHRVLQTDARCYDATQHDRNWPRGHRPNTIETGLEATVLRS